MAVNALDTALDNLNAVVEANTSTKNSVVAALNGIPALIDKAKADALAAGATETELASITDLSSKLTANNAEMAAAVIANTPAANP